MSTFFWEYWYYNIPNYILALLMYTVMGRAILALFVPDAWGNYIWRAFRAVSQPVLYVAHWISPAAVPGGFIPFIAVFWLMVLRVIFTMVMVDLGLTPPVTQAG